VVVAGGRKLLHVMVFYNFLRVSLANLQKNNSFLIRLNQNLIKHIQF
jgi:hypothetical protein